MAALIILFGWFITAMVKGIVWLIKAIVTILTVMVVFIKNIIQAICNSVQERKFKKQTNNMIN